MQKNWQTTVSGVGSILAAFGVLGTFMITISDSDVGTVPDYQGVVVAIGLILAGLGLLRAKDLKEK